MEKHKVICPYCGAGCQFNLLVQNGQVVAWHRRIERMRRNRHSVEFLQRYTG